MSGIGDNSGGAQLRSFVERLERLADEKAELLDLIRSVWAEVKSAGFDAKVLRALIKERAADKAALAEFNALLDTYRSAVGSLSDTPLGKAAEPKR